ncbi:MAG: serine hydrolase domain-containing protein [Pseudomonadales bacterium]
MNSTIDDAANRLSQPGEAVAIAKGDGTFLRADNQVLPLYSITKTYIAATLFTLDIDIEAPVSDWIDRALLDRGDRISVRQLLNHTSGLGDYGGLVEYTRAIQSGEPVWSDETFATHTLQRDLLFQPGRGWSYSNPGYWLLRQICQRHSGLDFATLIDRQVCRPLGLQHTRAVSGIFADDLPDYPAGWVWHGLLLGTPADTVKFLDSPLISPLLAEPVAVPGRQPGWTAPHYGYGLMIEPGVRYGHNGGGPGYSASCNHFIRSDRTLCVLTSAGDPEAAMYRLLTLERELASN